jgi:hypothetical protein
MITQQKLSWLHATDALANVLMAIVKALRTHQKILLKRALERALLFHSILAFLGIHTPVWEQIVFIQAGTFTQEGQCLQIIHALVSAQRARIEHPFLQQMILQRPAQQHAILL